MVENLREIRDPGSKLFLVRVFLFGPDTTSPNNITRRKR